MPFPKKNCTKVCLCYNVLVGFLALPPALGCRLAARLAPFSVVRSVFFYYISTMKCVLARQFPDVRSQFCFRTLFFVFAPVRLAKTCDLAGSSPPFWHCLGLEATQDSVGTREGTLGSGFTFRVFLSDLGIPLSHCVYCLGHKCLLKRCFDAFPMM